MSALKTYISVLRIFPGHGRKTGFTAGLLEKGVPVPVVFRGHLGQQQTPAGSVPNIKTVHADLNFIDVFDLPERGQHRNFQINILKFLGRQRREAGIAKSCRLGHLLNGLGQRFHRFDETDAAP